MPVAEDTTDLLAFMPGGKMHRTKEPTGGFLIPADFNAGRYVVALTASGLVKKTELRAFDTPIRSSAIKAMKLRDDDRIVAVRVTSGEDDLLMVAESGHALRISEAIIRPMGRDTGGIKGINTEAAGARRPAPTRALDLFVVTDRPLALETEDGKVHHKRTPVADFPVSGRGAVGVRLLPASAGRLRRAWLRD